MLGTRFDLEQGTSGVIRIMFFLEATMSNLAASRSGLAPGRFDMVPPRSILVPITWRLTRSIFFSRR
jgi:hypothetical protein